MTKDELWKIYTTKNPSFATGGAAFTAKGLYKFFGQTWDTAFRAGRQTEKSGRSAADDYTRPFPPDGPDTDTETLRSMLGMK